MSNNKSQTQTQTSAPWPAAQPALKLGLQDATNLYKSGVGSQPFTGSTVVPFAQQTTQAMGQMQQGASTAQPAFKQNFGQVAANAAQGGLNALQQGAVDRLKPMADGSMMNGNPFMDEVIRRTSEDIGGSANLMASAAGRYGSGGHQNVIADSVGDVSSKMRMANYDTERGYMQDAIGSLFNAGQQQQSNINANTGALADAYGGMMAPSQTLMNVGGMHEDLYGRQLNDQLRIFNEKQNAPWEQIARLNGIASGAGQLGGRQQTVAQGPNRLSAGLGGALTGFDATGGSLWGAGLGGLAGLL